MFPSEQAKELLLETFSVGTVPQRNSHVCRLKLPESKINVASAFQMKNLLRYLIFKSIHSEDVGLESQTSNNAINH